MGFHSRTDQSGVLVGDALHCGRRFARPDQLAASLWTLVARDVNHGGRNWFRVSAPRRPTTEMMVSMTVQVRRVWGTVRLRYSLTNQKPPSLRCERMSEPEPMASTSSSRLTC